MPVASSYPGALDSFTTKTDNVDDVSAAHMNDVQAAIVATQTEMGVNPADGPDGVAHADVATRLDTMHHIIKRTVGDNEVVNTVTETTVFTYTVPANTLSTNRALRLTMFADYLNNSGGTPTLIVKGKFGGTTVLTATITTIAANAARRGFMFQMTVLAKNATNAQVIMGNIILGNSGDGVAGTMASSNDYWGFYNSLAADTTSNQVIAVSVEHGTADAQISFAYRAAQLELL